MQTTMHELINICSHFMLCQFAFVRLQTKVSTLSLCVDARMLFCDVNHQDWRLHTQSCCLLPKRLYFFTGKDLGVGRIISRLHGFGIKREPVVG